MSQYIGWVEVLLKLEVHSDFVWKQKKTTEYRQFLWNSWYTLTLCLKEHFRDNVAFDLYSVVESGDFMDFITRLW